MGQPLACTLKKRLFLSGIMHIKTVGKAATWLNGTGRRIQYLIRYVEQREIKSWWCQIVRVTMVYRHFLCWLPLHPLSKKWIFDPLFNDGYFIGFVELQLLWVYYFAHVYGGNLNLAYRERFYSLKNYYALKLSYFQLKFLKWNKLLFFISFLSKEPAKFHGGRCSLLLS